MCYYNGRRITKAEYDELRTLEKAVAFLNEETVIHKGFDYNFMPVIRPVTGAHEKERVRMQWGFLPSWLKNREAVNKFRFCYKDENGKYFKPFTTLNATSEELLSNM